MLHRMKNDSGVSFTRNYQVVNILIRNLKINAVINKQKLSQITGGSAKNAEYKLAQSGDATCNGLDSAEV